MLSSSDWPESPDIQQRIAKLGIIPVDTPSPDELKPYIRSESTRWGMLVKKVGLAGPQ